MAETTTTEAGKKSSLINTKAMSADQMKVVEAIIKFHGGEVKQTQKQIIEANSKLYGKTYGPYFIIKNTACKNAKEHGIYNLGVLKMSAAAAKELANPKAEGDVPSKKKKKVSAKKKASGQTASPKPKAKKGGSKEKAPEQTPAEAMPTAEEMPVN